MGRRTKERIVRPKVEGEDRISSLPDDLIHRILSLIDARFAVQTSLLSTRWKTIWKSLSHLNFNCIYFSRILDFSEFVTKFLCHRDYESDLSVFYLDCRGAIPRSLVNRIAIYGEAHNLQQLTLSSEVRKLPPSVFISQSLKHLSLTSATLISEAPKSSWNLPALTTLFLDGVSFEFCWNDGNSKSVNFFSKLLNLKNLTLIIKCDITGLEVFNIISPQLENLHISFHQYATSPAIHPCTFVISAPKLSSFKYQSNKLLQISATDLDCLDKVYINIYNLHQKVRNYVCKQSVCQEIINLFHQFRDATLVTLTLQTIEVLSWVFELSEKQPSPFHKTISRKIQLSQLMC